MDLKSFVASSDLFFLRPPRARLSLMPVAVAAAIPLCSWDEADAGLLDGDAERDKFWPITARDEERGREGVVTRLRT